MGYGAEGGRKSLKGGWGGLDPLNSDVTATPAGEGGGSSDHWRIQPRVPAGAVDGGQWTRSELPATQVDDEIVTGAEKLLTDIRHVARVLGMSNHEMNSAIHSLKKGNGLSGNQNVGFTRNGDVYFRGEFLGNIKDYRK